MSTLLALGSLLASLVFGDLPPPPRPAPKPAPAAPAAQCSADSDCLVTMSGGCCGSCCPHPVAASKSEHQAERARCSISSCVPPHCERFDCARPRPMEWYVAVCRAHRCVLEEKERAAAAPPPPECRADSDCIVVYPGPGPDAACRTSPCGCCPGTEPAAAAAMRLEPDQREPQPTEPKPQPPPEKFVPAAKPEMPPPACSPCMGPAPARAACREGRCVLAGAPTK